MTSNRKPSDQIVTAVPADEVTYLGRVKSIPATYHFPELPATDTKSRTSFSPIAKLRRLPEHDCAPRWAKWP